MNFNYYDERYAEIIALFANGDDKKGLLMIEEELAMPYLPKDFEDKIIALKKKYQKKGDDKKGLDAETIEHYLLNGNEAEQLLAVYNLLKLNLRNYDELIRKYLKGSKSAASQALLISGMIEQGLNSEYQVLKDGMAFSFIPLYCENVEMMDGYLQGIAYLEEVFLKDPALLNMAKKLMAKVAFSFLPLSLDESEGVLYAKSIALYIYELFADEKSFDECKAVLLDDSTKLVPKEELERIIES